MRVAVVYDIHGNLPALEAVLKEVAEAGVERIVVGGDVVPGPMIRETFAALRSAGLPMDALYGNGEVAALEIRSGLAPARVPEAHRPAMKWCADQLTDDDEAAVRSWPLTQRLRIDGIGDVLFCHATPRDENEIFTERTAEDRIAPAFAGVDAALVVCGHTHVVMDRTIRGIRVVNPGSVGMPFGDPVACWMVIGDGRVDFRRTEYDLEAAAERIRGTLYPAAGEFAAKYVLKPPSASEMLDLYAKYEKK